jgi:TonB family protein
MTFLLDAAIKSSLVLLVALFAAWMLRRSSSAVRHFVLAAGLACAALSPALALVMPGWSVELPGPAQIAAPASFVETSTAPAGASAASEAPVATAPAATDSGTGTPVFTGQPVLLLWAAGVVAAFLSLCAGLARLGWIVRHASPTTHQRWLDVLTDVAARHGLARAPRLLQSRHPSLLVTWGVFRPTVLLPVSAPEWTSDRMRIVLDHELAHIARRDWLTQIGAEILRCVYWFNPLMWAACRRLRQESEQACDDRVLNMGHAGPAYASHLLDLARAFRSSDHAWIPAAAIARPSSLERRVAAMLTNDVRRHPVNLRTALAAVLLLAVVTLPIASYEAFAQARYATVSGTVTDESGAILVDAILVLLNNQTKAKYEVRSNDTGFYEFVGLTAGEYQFEAQRRGFEALKETVFLGVGETQQRNVTLDVGMVQETIRVGRGTPPRPQSVAPPAVRRTPRPCSNPSAGGCIGPPMKLKDVPPVYPPALENTGIEGEVEIEGIIGTDGRMKNMRVISSPHPDFERSALDAVGAWEFTATTLNGRSIETRIIVRVGFGSSPRVP